MPSSVTEAYAVKVSSIPKLLEEIRKAAVPTRFSQDFLVGLGFTSSNDRLLIGVLKGLGFLDGNGVPTDVYKEFRDSAKSKFVLARQIRKAYAGLFELNTEANNLTSSEVKGKLASITGQGENVVRNMAATFSALSSEADFSNATPTSALSDTPQVIRNAEGGVDSPASEVPAKPSFGSGTIGFSHTLYINLPATRDVAVYDAIFKALKEHLL